MKNPIYELHQLTTTLRSMVLVLLIISCQGKVDQSVKQTKTNQIANQSYETKAPKNTRSIDYDTTVWTEITADSLVQLDLRYATSNNFTKQVIYDCGRCFLRRPSALKFHQILLSLHEKGFGVKLFDCYRPQQAQFKLWEIVPNPNFVANPNKGSMHNRGLALDLTLTDLHGNELDLGTQFDYFGKRAYHDYTKLSSDILERRKILKETMAAHGFTHIRTEWWHYSDTQNKGEVSNYEWPCPN